MDHAIRPRPCHLLATSLGHFRVVLGPSCLPVAILISSTLVLGRAVYLHFQVAVVLSRTVGRRIVPVRLSVTASG